MCEGKSGHIRLVNAATNRRVNIAAAATATQALLFTVDSLFYHKIMTSRDACDPIFSALLDQSSCSNNDRHNSVARVSDSSNFDLSILTLGELLSFIQDIVLLGWNDNIHYKSEFLISIEAYGKAR